MESIIITPSDEKELDFLKTMIHKMKLKAIYVSEDEKEDWALGYLVKESRNTGYASKNDILKALE